MKSINLKKLRELTTIEQSNLLAGDGKIKVCDCGTKCECWCDGKELPGESTAKGNDYHIKSSKKQFMGYAPIV